MLLIKLKNKKLLSIIYFMFLFLLSNHIIKIEDQKKVLSIFQSKSKQTNLVIE